MITVFDLLQSGIEYNASITNLSLRGLPMLTSRVIDRGKALTTPIMTSQWKVMAGSRKVYAKYFLATGERNEVE